MVGAWRFIKGNFFTAPEAYENPKEEQQTAWPQRSHQLREGVQEDPTPKTVRDEVTLPVTPSSAQELTLTAVALGLATTSALFFAPAQVACLPLLLYLGATPVRTVYTALRGQESGHEESAPLALAETVVLALCLLRQAYLAGALSYGCYVVAKAWLQQPAETELPPVAWQPPAWVWVQLAPVASRKPVAELHSGERIVVHTGEMVPVAGVVIEGAAWVKRREVGCDKVGVGSKIEAMTIVQAGHICLVVG